LPTKNPRLMLTVKPELLAALTDLSAALGKPTATVTTDLLTEMIPHLEVLTRYARAVQSGQKDAAATALRHLVGQAMAEQLDLLK
jgi:hypothetical protein